MAAVDDGVLRPPDWREVLRWPLPHKGLGDRLLIRLVHSDSILDFFIYGETIQKRNALATYPSISSGGENIYGSTCQPQPVS
jgi:hypothetical protein